MIALVVLVGALACASAKPQFFAPALGYSGLPYAAAPVHYAAAPVSYAAPAVVAPAFTKTQYHAQDELGQASYGYAHPGQAHATVRDAFGNVRGSYAYIDPNGKEVRVNYVADAGGFRAESNALPEGPVATLVGPAVVQETPEVAAARAEHLRAVAEVKSRQKRGISYAAPALTYAAPAVHYAAAPALTYAHGLSYAGVPAVGYAATYAHPLAYSAPTVVAAGHPLREATLTKVVNTPGHAVSYRVD